LRSATVPSHTKIGTDAFPSHTEIIQKAEEFTIGENAFPSHTEIIRKAILHDGFSLVDVYSICRTYYGRQNKKGSPSDMLAWQKEHLIPTARYRAMSAQSRIGKKEIGILSVSDYPEYTAEYARVIEASRVTGDGKERRV
jgi:pyruvate/2-oxoacid:ferredoxin oxidoreductase beta subunit